MGKIYEALTKYSDAAQRAAQDQPPRCVALNQSDLEALINYDRETGHLVRYDRETGQVDMGGIEALRKQGSIQRLLENELIHAGGKLTQRGLAEVQRLHRIVQHRKAAAARGGAPKSDPAEPVRPLMQQGEPARELPTQSAPSRTAGDAPPPDAHRVVPAEDKPEDEFLIAFDALEQTAEPFAA